MLKRLHAKDLLTKSEGAQLDAQLPSPKINVISENQW